MIISRTDQQTLWSSSLSFLPEQNQPIGLVKIQCFHLVWGTSARRSATEHRVKHFRLKHPSNWLHLCGWRTDRNGRAFCVDVQQPCHKSRKYLFNQWALGLEKPPCRSVTTGVCGLIVNSIKTGLCVGFCFCFQFSFWFPISGQKTQEGYEARWRSYSRRANSSLFLWRELVWVLKPAPCGG